MDITKIIQDVIHSFLGTNNATKFWENDEEITNFFIEILPKFSLESGSDAFSLMSGMLHDTSAYFKTIGTVSVKLWKPVLSSTEKKAYDIIKDDYDIGLGKYRKNYPAPVPAILNEAELILKQLHELCTISEVVSEEDTETVEYIRNKASGYISDLLGLFNQLDDTAREETTYITGIQAIETYKAEIGEAFDILIGLSKNCEVA